ncbi:molybdopterin-dependent oxidoreductase [Pseudorhodoferax sp.]|uniref:molybdopterin-dependent oxidoreductase n=1 Tax=Pseudorhodoferax sp. TaxID=1993553 RepID=UPI002DD6981D|nr:molybdopterin-dependent oxidoreductase [Pseudorhodoferax sp.]
MKAHALTATHWGLYQIDGSGPEARLAPCALDPAPSPIGLDMVRAVQSEQRVRRPAVRRSWLDAGIGAHPDRRGSDAFVEIPWDEALDLAAQALRSTIDRHGNEAVFGGSYGWASAGRFHHAQSQVHRFLNMLGGYVRHTDSYSLGAARVLMPHIVAPMDELNVQHTSWNVLAEHTRLFITFGGVPWKNAQVTPGGVGEHAVPGALAEMRRRGVRFVNISPVASDIDTGGPVEWIPIRPNTDAALLIGMAHTLLNETLLDHGFLQSHCVGFDRFAAYLQGRPDGVVKDARWAGQITGVPATCIEALARAAAAQRTTINMAWSLQRAHHGEQPFWALVTVAAMLGQIGLPGGGFGVGYGATNMIGNANPRFSGPTLPQGDNPVKAFIPVARLADMLEQPGQPFDYNGQRHHYPEIHLVYWAGGNPFHHHQNLSRLMQAWRRPRHVIVHEQFWTATAKLADLVLPATTTLERSDIAYASRERYMVAMRRVLAPVGEARDDYQIFQSLARRLGVEQAFTEGRTAEQWLQHLYGDCIGRAGKAGVQLPSFENFWATGVIDLAQPEQGVVMLEAFRQDPGAHPLKTPSGRIEIYSDRIAGFGYADCPGHACWLEPVEWAGAPLAQKYPLHLLSDQPATKLHSQLDHGSFSAAAKVHGREPLQMNRRDAAARGLRDGQLVRVFNGRGACLAALRCSDQIAQGAVKLSTGAWFDPAGVDTPLLDKHGNPNALTLDLGASRLSQGCSAQTCLVEVVAWDGPAPDVTAFKLPPFTTLETTP